MNIAYSRTLLMMVIPLGVLAGACTDDGDGPSEDYTRAEATIENRLPVDGCSYPVKIGDVSYAPDADSREAVGARVGSASSVTVEIDYRVTGRTGQVECGFITTQELPEITVAFP